MSAVITDNPKILSQLMSKSSSSAEISEEAAIIISLRNYKLKVRFCTLLLCTKGESGIALRPFFACAEGKA